MTIGALLQAHGVAVYILLAALGIGGGTLRLLRLPARGVERTWLAWVGGLGVLSVATLLLGMAGLLYSWLFVLLLAPCAVAGVWLLAQSGSVQATGAWLLSWRNAGAFGWLAYTLLLLSLGSVLWIWLAQAIMIPYEWDELIYHLTVPKLFNEAHATIFIPWNCFSLWPLNNEMLFGIALLLGSDIAPHFITLWMTILTAAGIVLLARRYLDDRVGIVAAALFISVPLVKRLAGTALIDLALSMYVLAAFAALLQWQRTRQWQWLVFSGCMCGFAAGSKLSGVAFLGLFGLLVLFDALRQRPLRISNGLHGILFGCSGLLMVAPWYLRSYVWSGNPIWPFGYSLFGGRDWDALGNEYLTQAQLDVISPNFHRTPYWLIQSFVYIVTQPYELGRFPGGFGVVIPVCALVAVLLLQRMPHMLRQGLLICGLFYLLWFAFLPLQIRYLIPVLPLLVLATAYVFIWLYQKASLRLFRVVLALGLVVIIAREWPWIASEDRALLASHMPVLRGEMTAEAWIDAVHKGHALVRYANDHLPDDAHILLIPYEVRTFYLNKDYVWGSLTAQRYIPFEQFNTAADLAAYLHQRGITYVIDNPDIKYDRLRYWEHDRALMLALRDQCGNALFRQGEAVVYALKACEAAVASK